MNNILLYIYTMLCIRRKVKTFNKKIYKIRYNDCTSKINILYCIVITSFNR